MKQQCIYLSVLSLPSEGTHRRISLAGSKEPDGTNALPVNYALTFPETELRYLKQTHVYKIHFLSFFIKFIWVTLVNDII